MNDYFELAQNFFREKKYQKSLENYLLALRIKPNSISILIPTALNYMVLKKYEEEKEAAKQWARFNKKRKKNQK